MTNIKIWWEFAAVTWYLLHVCSLTYPGAAFNKAAGNEEIYPVAGIWTLITIF